MLAKIIYCKANISICVSGSRMMVTKCPIQCILVIVGVLDWKMQHVSDLTTNI